MERKREREGEGDWSVLFQLFGWWVASQIQLSYITFSATTLQPSAATLEIATATATSAPTTTTNNNNITTTTMITVPNRWAQWSAQRQELRILFLEQPPPTVPELESEAEEAVEESWKQQQATKS